MDLSNTTSKWDSTKLKAKVIAYECKWMSQKALRKSIQVVNPKYGQFPKVTISSQTEIGRAEASIEVPKQRAYTGRQPVISSSLADIPCSSLGVEGLLDLLNTTLATSYTLNTPYLSSVLKDYVSRNHDFGTAYGRLRETWCNHPSSIQMELQKREAEDIMQRRYALDGSRIVYPDTVNPRRVWDLYSNRVVPWWCCNVDSRIHNEARPISHAWVGEADRVDVWTPINGHEWPVPIPKGANLDFIRIEMLNLGLEYTWLDVLCLRQKGGPWEDLRIEEWKLDVPTIGAIYYRAFVVWYLSGLGLPLRLKEGNLESDQWWFRRAWTVQEIGWMHGRTIAGDTPDGPLHAKLIDEAGNYDKILAKFYKQLKSASIDPVDVYGALSVMQGRISTNPVDKVAGLAFSLFTFSLPAYYESQSLEDAWTALVNEMHGLYRGLLFFTYPEPGTGSKKWRPSWEQVMTKPLPKHAVHWGLYRKLPPILAVERAYDDDWHQGFHIERGFVRGLSVGGEEGIERCGELVVEDAHGKVHSFNILASHQYPIPEDTYTLRSCSEAKVLALLQGSIGCREQWIVGRQLPRKRFEKVSVFGMADTKEIKRLKKLAAKSCIILV